jgi:type II secretory pathway pseudopilin PulG
VHPTRPTDFSRARRAGVRAFTLVEVLAALLMMSIVVPVTMQAVAVASRAGLMGQRKAAAMRVADRVINETVISGQALSTSSSGSVMEGDATYAWTLASESWSEDPLTVLTVTVQFIVQGETYAVSASTLIDPNVGATTSSSPTNPGL